MSVHVCITIKQGNSGIHPFSPFSSNKVPKQLEIAKQLEYRFSQQQKKWDSYSQFSTKKKIK